MSLSALCRRLGLSKGRYYYQPSQAPTYELNQILKSRIRALFLAHNCLYGYRRITEQLRLGGMSCSRGKVRRLMKEQGLKARQQPRFHPRTSDGRASHPSPNLLKELKAPPQRPGMALGADFTYIKGQGCFYYLAVVMDLCSRRVLGWSLREDMSSELVVEALKKALPSGLVRRGAIFHSDRGSQYSAGIFREVLKACGLQQSMSDRGNPYDNAMVESFFGTLKKECLDQPQYAGLEEVRRKAFEYIEGYYNTRRLHSSLGYMAPAAYEQKVLKA